jgi:peptidoglycan/xylan/chitin deacetylase (PgdA/CDA1 family)
MKLALRIDDIGASSKQFEVYSKIPGGNILFLKYIKPFKAWGPYNELSVEQWLKVFDILKEYNAKLTIAITAAWVERDGQCTPFPQKFPKQAVVLKNACNQGIIEIANHGLTHCVLGKHLPRLFFSNRKFHREFWDWLNEKTHYEHIEKSQKVLQDYFQIKITTLIPPGNVFSDVTVKAADKFGINLINCHTENKNIGPVRIVGEENVFAFHDRDIILKGVNWLERQLLKLPDARCCFIRDLS